LAPIVANGLLVFVTVHPSALVRLEDEDDKRSGYASFLNDLRFARQLTQGSRSEARSGARTAE
jgi:uracil-DNA glycosylase